MVADTPFGIRMRELALTGHERADELLDMADEFDAAVDDPAFNGMRLVRVWARCWRLWEECTGESAFDGVAEKAAKLAAHLVLTRMNGKN